MAQYTPVTHAQLLEEHAVRYTQPDLIADLAIPTSPTTVQLVKYPTFRRRDAYRITDAEMAPDGEPNQRKFVKTTSEVNVRPYGLFDRFPIADQDDDSVIGDQEIETVEDLSGDLLLNREKRVADLLFTAASYGAANKITLGTAWTSSASTPVADVQTGIRACLVKPNKMICGKLAFDALARHPDIISGLRGIGGSTNGLATGEEIARYFGLEKVLVGEARYDSANPGATESLSYIWTSTQVVIARIPDEPRRNDVMLARTYRYRPQGTSGVNVYQELELKRGTRGTVYTKVSYDEISVLVAADVGYQDRKS